jgi:formylglycine-generating enzyme required for sulfatase activity
VDGDDPGRRGGLGVAKRTLAVLAAAVVLGLVSIALIVPLVSNPPAVRVALRAALDGQAIVSRRFTECPDCPQMVALPGGSINLGSALTEFGRQTDEGPQVRVVLQPFAVSRFEVTRSQYAAFVRETGRGAVGNCWTITNAGGWEPQQGANWQSPGFDQGDDHPVVCVSWDDAQAYVGWINGKVAGDPYRLLTEAEWEFAARAATQSRFWWGDDEANVCAYANLSDQSAQRVFPAWTGAVSCNDGHVFTAPVGASRIENGFGLADMAGNVWEWTQDCYGPYALKRGNGKPYMPRSCEDRVRRGGAWVSDPQDLRSANRIRGEPQGRGGNFGFRIARDL